MEPAFGARAWDHAVGAGTTPLPPLAGAADGGASTLSRFVTPLAGTHDLVLGHRRRVLVE